MTRYAIDHGVQVIQFLHLINGENERGFSKGSFGGIEKGEVDHNFEYARRIGKEGGIDVILPSTDPRPMNCELLRKSIVLSAEGVYYPCCRLDRKPFNYNDGPTEDVARILNQQSAFYETLLSNKECNTCAKFLWNYQTLMDKLHLQQGKNEK